MKHMHALKGSEAFPVFLPPYFFTFLNHLLSANYVVIFVIGRQHYHYFCFI